MHKTAQPDHQFMKQPTVGKARFNCKFHSSLFALLSYEIVFRTAESRYIAKLSDQTKEKYDPCKMIKKISLHILTSLLISQETIDR